MLTFLFLLISTAAIVLIAVVVNHVQNLPGTQCQICGHRQYTPEDAPCACDYQEMDMEGMETNKNECGTGQQDPSTGNQAESSRDIGSNIPR